MYFDLLKILSKPLLLISLTLFCLQPLFAFQDTLESIYKQDKELLLLKQREETIKKEGLQATLRDSKNMEDSIQHSIALRKDRLLLQTLFYHLKKMQREKNIALIAQTNKQLFTLYNEEILPKISEYDKKTLKEISLNLSKIKQLFKEQQTALNQINKKLEDYKNIQEEDLQLKEAIQTTPLLQNAQKSFALFQEQPPFEKEITAKTLAIPPHRVDEFLKSSYHSYLNLLKRFQNSTQKILKLHKEKDKKLSSSKKIAYELSLLQARLSQESIKLKMLLSKSSIFYVTGMLKPMLFHKNLLTSSPKLPPAQEKKSKKKSTSLRRIHFVGNSSTITSYSLPIVKSHAKKLKKMENYTLELHGHSDTKGPKKRNFELSQMRTEEVKKALIGFGVPKERIKTFAYGDSKPIASNKTEKGRLLNRRVEFKIIEEK